MMANDLKHAANRIILRMREFPALPVFADRLIRLNTLPERPLAEISRMIEAEVALAASLLKLVNSPLSGIREQVLTIPRAIELLDSDELINLVMAGVMFESYKDVNGHKQFLASLGRHSFRAAIVARYLGKCTTVARPDYFLAGLLHDIGKNVLCRDVECENKNVDFCKEPQSQTEIETERKNFGVDHAFLGASLLAAWNFPRPLQVAVKFHHEPQNAHEFKDYALITHTADSFAHILDMGESGDLGLHDLFRQRFSESTNMQLLDLGIDLYGKGSVFMEELEALLAEEGVIDAMFGASIRQ